MTGLVGLAYWLTMRTTSAHTVAVPMLVALASLVIPAVIGILAGLGARLATRRLRHLSWLRPLLLGASVLPFGLPFVLPAYVAGLAFWDVLQLCWVTGGSYLLTALLPRTAVTRRTIAASTMVALLCLAVLELGCRMLLPPVETGLLPPWKTHLFFPMSKGIAPDGRGLFDYLFLETFPVECDQQLAKATSRPELILHVGDSMVGGTGEARERAFSDVLHQESTATSHINGGVAGTGPDYYFALTLNWLERLPANHVVIYLFSGNDLSDLGKPYAFCDNQTLLRKTERGFERRCPVPTWGGMTWRRAALGPPAYALRVLSHYSAAARQLMILPWRLFWTFESPPDPTAQLPRIAEIMASMRDQLTRRQIEFTVVLFPDRLGLEGNPRAKASCLLFRETLAETLTEAGIRTIDLTTFLAPLVDRDGSDRWFLNDHPGDAHLNVAGHQALARWLAPRL